MGVRDRIAKALSGGIKAFHSSPHDFDKFDLGKIGTGEGAQVYGHGIYAAENPKVSGQGGQYWQQFKSRFEGPERAAADLLEKQNFDRDRALLMARKYDRLGIPDTDNPFKGLYPPTDFGEVKKLLQSGQPVGPRTYELNINADPAHMLDWDKPIEGQHAYKALREHWDDKVGDPDIIAERMGISPSSKGGRLYSGIGGLTQNQVASSQMLQDAGVPGIKYLDEGSRGRQYTNKDALWQEPLTSNYVVFDPGIIDITKKYALPGAIGVGGAAGGWGETGATDRYEETPR